MSSRTVKQCRRPSEQARIRRNAYRTNTLKILRILFSAHDESALPSQHMADKRRKRAWKNSLPFASSTRPPLVRSQMVPIESLVPTVSPASPLSGYYGENGGGTNGIPLTALNEPLAVSPVPSKQRTSRIGSFPSGRVSGLANDGGTMTFGSLAFEVSAVAIVDSCAWE